jgi:uncharacterized protein
MGAPEFTISTGDLDSGGRKYVFPVRAAWMRGALEEHEATAAGPDGTLDIRASKSGNDIVVHGTLSAVLSVPCARCLEPVEVPVHEPVSALFAPRASPSHAGEKGREISPEEADTLPYDGETAVLDDFVRDELILETPSFPLCSEDCPGISPSLTPRGENSAPAEPVDPRLSPLRRLLDPKE